MPTDESRVLFLSPWTTTQDFYSFVEEVFLAAMGGVSGEYDAGSELFLTVHSDLFAIDPYQVEVWGCSGQNSELIGSWLVDCGDIMFLGGRIDPGDNSLEHHIWAMGFFMFQALRLAGRTIDRPELVRV